MLCCCRSLVHTQPFFTRITESDGLADNRITCFLQDKKGYLWISTKRGISRYDGVKFETLSYEQGKENSIPSNEISKLAEDKHGNIWIATNNAGIACYNTITKKISTLHAGTDGLINDGVGELYVDDNNILWIGYYGYGWSAYDIDKGIYKHYQVAANKQNVYGRNMMNAIDGFIADKNGNMWVASNQGLHYLQISTGRISTYKDSFRNNNDVADNLFTSIYMQNDTTIWLGTWAAGLKKFNTKTKTFTQYLFAEINNVYGIRNIVLSITQKNKHELWIASADKGLGIFNLNTKQFTFYEHKADNVNTPLPRECRILYTDKEGSLWAGFDAGITRCIPQMQRFKFHSIAATNKEYLPSATAFYKDGDMLYFGAEGGAGLYIHNSKTGTEEIIRFTNKNDFIKSNYSISGLLPYDNNNVLLLLYNGIYLYNKQSKKIIKKIIADQENKPIGGGGRLMQDAEGNYWFSNVAIGIYKVDKHLNKAVHYYEGNASPVKFSNNRLHLLLAEDAQTIWIHQLDNSIYVLNPVKNLLQKIILNNTIDTLLSVTDMHKLGKDNYLVSGFNFGLMIMHKIAVNSYQCRFLNNKQGVTSDEVHNIIADNEDNVWAAMTGKGPAVLQADSTFKTYTTKEGFLWGSDLYSMYAVPHQIYLSVHGGYVVMSTANNNNIKCNYKVLLQSFKIFDKEWNDSIDLDKVKNIELNYDQNFINASFVVPSFINTDGIKYSYMLQGLDKEWVDGNGAAFLSYSGLQPGKYVLKIKAVSASGIEIAPFEINIIIHAPFWQRWWFYLLLALFTALIIILIYRYRISVIKKEEKIKSAFNKKIAESEMKALRAQMNPHFIFNSLNSINRYIVKSDAETASRYLTRFSKLIRLILDSSAAETTLLSQEILLLQLYIEMEALRFTNKFTYEIVIGEGLNADTVHIPSMIIQPYVENAIWHGLLHKKDVGHLKLVFEKDNHSLRVTIADNGIGRVKARELNTKDALKQKSYGMQISGDRLKIANAVHGLQATVVVQDLYNSNNEAIGTEVILHIPIDNIK